MSSHVGPTLRTYLSVFAALICLTAVTTAVSYLHLGKWNTLIALSIACLKASLVALVFMHLRWSRRIVWIFAGGGLFWLVVLLSLVLGDYQTRQAVVGW
jgi:cytochrome c oxidase subunit 4